MLVLAIQLYMKFILSLKLSRWIVDFFSKDNLPFMAKALQAVLLFAIAVLSTGLSSVLFAFAWSICHGN